MAGTAGDHGRSTVVDLVSRYVSRRGYYASDDFDETSTREQFINPLFEALGWDVLDRLGLGPDRDVVYHRRLGGVVDVAGEEDWDDDLSQEEIEERLHRISIPDYSFRVDGVLKFFVEAKRPSVSLHGKGPCFQVKSYAWSQRSPIAVLTNFLEFRVFDCTLRPDYDRPDQGLLSEFDLPCTEFVDRWDDLLALLSRDAVAEGSIERLGLAARRRVRGAVRVDEAFLRELSEWRETLAVDLAARNHGLRGYPHDCVSGVA